MKWVEKAHICRTPLILRNVCTPRLFLSVLRETRYNERMSVLPTFALPIVDSRSYHVDLATVMSGSTFLIDNSLEI